MRSLLVSLALAVAGTSYGADPVITPAMRKALDALAPGFAPWGTLDYTQAVRKDAAGRKAVPWALVLDVNGDGKTDLLLDGHDKTRSLLVCLVSKGAGYTAVQVESAELVTPSRLVSYDDGKKAVGIPSFLTAHEDRKGFSHSYPQTTDAKGEPLGEGSSVDYHYEGGRFEESSQAL